MNNLTPFQTAARDDVKDLLAKHGIVFSLEYHRGESEEYLTVDFWKGCRIWIYRNSAEITRDRIFIPFEMHKGTTPDELREDLKAQLDALVAQT